MGKLAASSACRCIGRCGRVDFGNADMRAFTRHSQSAFPTDAAATTGDENYLICLSCPCHRICPAVRIRGIIRFLNC